MKFRGGGATRKTAPDSDLTISHSEDKDNLSPKPLKKTSLESFYENRYVILSLTQNLSILIKNIWHFWWQKRKKAAFTMAEVLITLGIIGIIAAMTLPGLIGKWQKTVYVNRMKKTYSVIANAFLMAREDYGDPREWEYGTTNRRDNLMRILNTYLLPYLNLDSKSKVSEDPNSDLYPVWLKDGTTLTFRLDGSYTVKDDPSSYRVTTIYIIVSHKNKTSKLTAADRDYSREDYILRFNMYNGNLMFFNLRNSTSREAVRDDATYGCNANVPKNMRLNCGQLIFMDGWQIKDDYPW